MSDLREDFLAIVQDPLKLGRVNVIGFALEGTLLNADGRLNRRMVPVFLHVAAQQNDSLYYLTNDKKHWRALEDATRRHRTLSGLIYLKDEFYDVMRITEQRALVFDTNPDRRHLQGSHVHINPEDDAVREFLKNRGYKQDTQHASVILSPARPPVDAGDSADHVQDFSPYYRRDDISRRMADAVTVARRFGPPKPRHT